MSTVAGMVGMGLGGLIAAFWGNRTEKMISIFLSFAGGVMTSIVFIELLPEAVELAEEDGLNGMLVAIIGLIIGTVLVFGLNYVIDKISSRGKKKSKLHDSYAEYFHVDDMIASKNRMLRSGIIILAAIGLHNFPEGLAIGAAGTHDIRLGLTLAIMIGLHCIPEGMAVAAPLISGGLTKKKAVILTFLIGVPTVIGAGVGILVGGVSDLAVALSFSIAGGAMLYVVFGEIIPQSIATNKDRIPTIFVLVGIVVGMFMTMI